MLNHIPTPIIHHYREVNPGKYSGVKHYELEKVSNGKKIFSDQINVSKDRKYANSTPDYWLKIRENGRWSNPITGLFKSGINLVYYGDSQKKQNLILAIFKKNASNVIICYFRNYYTNDISHIIDLTVSKINY
jgi:hypothetical protein